jgi:hypothetical protein
MEESLSKNKWCIAYIKNGFIRKIVSLFFLLIMILLFIPFGVIPILLSEIKRAWFNLDFSRRVIDNIEYGVKAFKDAWRGLDRR